jgi:linoleoyl-CoA desaturase
MGRGGERKLPADRNNRTYNPALWYVDGIAYDFKNFIKNHPGGEYALYLGQGRECMPMVYSYHMDVDKVKKHLEAYRCPEDMQLQDVAVEKFEPFKKFTFAEDGFYATLKREVKEYFDSNNMSHKGGFGAVVSFVVTLAIMIACMYLMCTSDSYILAYAAGFLHAFCRALMVVQHTHGASHFALSNSATVNRWVYRLGTIFIGLWNPKVWDLQHVVAHHVYTNEWPYDTDSAFPIKSIAYNQRRFGYHRFQHIYMWVVYAFTIPLVYLNSLKDTIVGKQVLWKMKYQAQNARAEAWACSVCGGIYLAIPFLILPFTYALCLSLYTNALSSVIFSFQFVVNHEVDKEGVMDGPPPATVDWGAYQVSSSNTFSGDSYFKTWLAGGLNTQIEHHLFPGVWYAHYVPIRKIIQKVCKDFNLHYNDSPNLMDALKCHYRLLKNPPASVRNGDSKKLA